MKKDIQCAKSYYEKIFEGTEFSPEYHLEGYRYDISEQIFSAMERAGLIKSQFAEKLDVSKGRITQILSGTCNFTLETLVKISEVLNTELRLTIRPHNWEQILEFTNDPFYGKEYEAKFSGFSITSSSSEQVKEGCNEFAAAA